MALVDRYFSTASAGSGDGTTWANRAALFSAGAWSWSTVITGFDFSGADGMRPRVGPGSYSITASLAGSSFTVAAPSITNPILFHGCDSAGNLLTPPNPAWTADQPAWDDSSLPVLATTSNINTIAGTAGAWFARLLKFTASGRTSGQVISSIGSLDWCVVSNSGSGASASILNGPLKVTNCVCSTTATSYQYIALFGSNAEVINSRFTGVAGSSGNRDGISSTPTSGAATIHNCAVLGVGGSGYIHRRHVADRHHA